MQDVILSENSVPVEENLPVTFIKVKFTQGRAKTGEKWTALDLLFKHEENGRTSWLNHKLFQPAGDKFLEQQQYANTLAELLDTLGGQDLWDNLPKSKKSWKQFYENYLELIDRYRNTQCYIKTLCCPDWQDRSKVRACLADIDFISMSSDLKYTMLENNLVEEVVESESKFNDNINPNFEY